MIIDSLKNAHMYYHIHNDIKDVVQFLSQPDVKKKLGKYVIREGDVWINILCVSGSTPETDYLFEAHRNFVDLHVILQGHEVFGYSNIENLNVKTPYCTEGDCEVLEGDPQMIEMNEGDFCLLFPQDAHVPDLKILNDGQLIRAVAKIRLNAPTL